MHRFLLSVTDNGAVSVLLFGLILAVSLFAIFMLLRSIRNERVNFSERKNTSDKFSVFEMQDFVKKRIQTAGRRTVFTIIQMDIHDHSTLKENFGPVQYENLLDEIHQKLSAVLPENTKISYSDKTFYFYLRNDYSIAQQNYLANMLLAEFSSPFTLVGTLKIEVDVNICAASYPESGKTGDELLNNLELAMIVSKRKGLNNFVIYNKSFSNEDTEEYRYYKEIKSAIENKEFLLYYQPIVSLQTLEVAGAESLLRWNHKTLGILPPSKFLNIIEHSGDIYWVGIWAFEQLIKHAALIKKAMPSQNIFLSMNLSPKQLLNPELASEMRRLLRKHRAKASDFCLEIVEFAMFDKMTAIRDNIVRLRQIGFRIAIDNYGLELSSLAELTRLPIDIIKIDKAFLAQSEENIMVTNIVQMLTKYAAENQIMVIAEGIETPEILARLQKFNLGYGQGYHFSVPKDISQFVADADILPWAAN